LTESNPSGEAQYRTFCLSISAVSLIHSDPKVQNESTHPRLVIIPFCNEVKDYVGRNDFKDKKGALLMAEDMSMI